MRIQHNIPALNSYRNYNNNAGALSKNLEKLSSGYRINRAGDDAAGLAISEKMRAQITGLDAAQKNVQDGISLVKTAEGALQEVQDMLNRMAYLATQSANGTYEDQVDRENLQAEMDALLEEIDRISEASNFNGRKLLDGSLGGMSIKSQDAVVPTAPTIGGEVQGVDAGGTTSPVKFEYAPSFDPSKKQTMTVLGKYFEIGPAENGASMAAAEDGSQENPFKIVTTASDTTKTISDKIAAKLNAENENAGVAYGGKNFNVTVDDAGKMTFTATSNGNLTVGETIYTDADDLTAQLKTDITLKEVETPSGGGDDKVSAPTLGTPVYTAGNVEVGTAGQKAVYTIDLATTAAATLAKGDTVTVNGKTYEFVENDSDSVTGSNIKVMKGDSTADGLANLATAIGQNDTEYTASYSSNTLTLTKTSAGKVGSETDAGTAENLKYAVTVANSGSAVNVSETAATVQTAGTDNSSDYKAASNGSAVFTITGADKLAAGDTIKIGDTTYELVGSESDSVTGGNEKLVVGTVAADTVAAALTGKSPAISGYGVEVSGEGTTITITITPESGGTDNTAQTLEAALKDKVAVTDKSGSEAPASLSPANFDHLIDTAAAAGDTDGVGQTEVHFSSNPQLGSSFTVDGNTFEFIAKTGDATKNTGAIGVVIGADLAATMENLKTAIGGATYTNVKVSVSDDKTTYLFKNNATVTDDPTVNNEAPEVKADGGGLKLQIGDTGNDYNVLTVSIDDMSTEGLNIDSLRSTGIMSIDSANAAIQTIKDAINTVSKQRGNLGAIQNRLEHTSNNLSVMEENIQNAESAIRDTDIADEMTAYTKNNILLQSAQAMLAQANQMPQGVLQLLQ